VGAVVLGVLAVVLATTLGDGERPGRRPELEPDPSFTPSEELTVAAAARVCLQVQLIRNGEPSTSTQECVE
jgi:hypothetical protein